MKYLVFFSALTSFMLFPVICACLGWKYQGASESNSYKLFCFVSAALSYLFIFLCFAKNKWKIRKNNILLLAFPVVIVLLYIIESPQNDIALRLFTEHLLWGSTAIYIALYIAKYRLLKKLAFPLLAFCFLSFISLWVSVILPFMHGKIFESFAGSSYQELSYIASFSFSIILFFALFYKKIYPSLNLKYYTYLAVIPMALYVVCIFISGGRGGMIVVVLSLLVYGYLWKDSLRKQWKSIIILTLFFCILFIYIEKEFLNDERFLLGAERVFSYISSDGVDVSKASHRDQVYLQAINVIRDNPIYGYGFFSYLDVFKRGYPHNFFLEILLQGGVVFLYIIVFLILYFFYKLCKMIKFDNTHLLLMPFLLFPIVKLMFSGSYITEPFFWFCLAYVFSYENTPHL